jgi:hypothetical protein
MAASPYAQSNKQTGFALTDAIHRADLNPKTHLIYISSIFHSTF